MVTWMRDVGMGALVLGAVGAFVACGGETAGGSSSAGAGANGASSGGGTATVDPLPGTGTAYDGHGFVVHEWGTNTVVVNASGEMQVGLHHEEEDLPSFVYDRLRAKSEPGAVEVKMETPVTYFYSDTPRDVNARVEFPKGVLTQWYPKAASFYPLLADPGDGSGVRDPALDPHYPFQSATCSSQYGVPKNGLLDWGTVHVGGRETLASNGPDAPLAHYTWSHAREVASNPLEIATDEGTQREKFLFYRGLGNADLPAKIVASGPSAQDGGVSVQNLAKQPLGALFVLRVGADRAAFQVHPEGLAPGATLDDVAPPLDGSNAGSCPAETCAVAQPLDAYSDALARAVVRELDRTGLYHDESVAMVNTWRRQWFRTPGVRLLYLAPQAWTDALIPLTITPAPDRTTRAMMIRVEFLTPAIHDEDATYLRAMDSAGVNGGAAYTDAKNAARQHFQSLGRFAEPRLRSALAEFKPGNFGGFLDEFVGAHTQGALGE